MQCDIKEKALLGKAKDGCRSGNLISCLYR